MKIVNNLEKAADFVLGSGKKVICMRGDLGAGKTTLVQEICRKLGVETEVTSPTFSIINVYDYFVCDEYSDIDLKPQGKTCSVLGDGTFYHIDLYRIEEERELDELGIYDIIDSESLVAIEWADRYPFLFPEDALWLDLGIDGEGNHYVEVKE